MTRQKRLTESFVRRVRRPGVYGDGRGGHGLQLRVYQTSAGHLTRRWRQQLRIKGRVTQVGLGWWPAGSLADARIAALHNAVAVSRGEDPRNPTEATTGRVAASVAVPVEAVGPTFAEAAERVIELSRPGWRTEGPEKTWKRCLAVLPFAAMPVADVQAGDILRAVEDVWTRQPAKARNILGIVSKVLRWAVAAGHRTDDPTAAVRAGLPKQNGKVEHHRAVAVADVPAAVERIAAANTGHRALGLAIRFAILTAARQNEVFGATWREIDMHGRVWTVPAARMKSGREHRVPLSAAALQVLRQLGPGQPDALIFPGRKGQRLGRRSLANLMARAGLKGKATVHGFRSSFRDWCGEQGIDRTLAELSLAHRFGDATEQAYARADLLERRREVMDAWGKYTAPSR